MSEDRDDNVTEGWPQEDRTGDLADFAARLSDQCRPLPPDSIQRVHDVMTRALDRRASRQRAWRIVRGFAAAAVVVLAIGLIARQGGKDNQNRSAGPTVAVHDRYIVPNPPAPRIAAPARPLVNLDDYAALTGIPAAR